MWPFKKNRDKTDIRRDYEALGKQLVALYDHLNPDRKGLYRTAFLKGIVTGLGGVVGATLVVAILAWTLTLLGHVPFLGRITDNARQTIQEQRQ